jgi:hypothetical protein
MEKRIDMDALRVLPGGVMGKSIDDGQERRRDGTEKRIASLMRLSKEGDRSATLELARAMLGDDYPGGR